jgi:hypothetical protein
MPDPTAPAPAGGAPAATPAAPAPAAPAPAAAPAKLSLAQELAAAKAELANPEAAPAPKGTPSAAAAPGADPGPATPAPEAPAAPDPAKETTAQRLARVAREADVNRRTRQQLDADKKAIDDAKAELRADRELLAKIRNSPSKVDKIKVLLGGDDEAVAELFMELEEYHAKGGSKPKLSDEERIRKAVADAIADERKKTEEGARQTEAKKREAEQAVTVGRANYRQAALELLEAHPDRFPALAQGLTAKEVRDITTIAEGAYEETGKFPSPEEVLRAIEAEKGSQRREPEKPRAEQSAENGATTRSTTIRRDDVPVTPSRPLSLAEELEAAKEELRRLGK